MTTLLYLALFLPLVSFIGLAFSSSYIGRKLTHFIGCAAILIPFLCFATLLWFYNQSNLQENYLLYHWIPVEGINADFSLHVDALSLLMSLIITGVGFLIHLYSCGYIEHEEDYARYFACLNFFVFAMLLLVLAGNLLLLFVGWEGVGLASYLLIGYWYHRPTAAAAATKAFVVNRIGDAGLLIALLLTFYLFGTDNFTEISQQAGKMFSVGAPILTLLTSLYFIGAMGKSAQIPLHVWLADAMEGPTPVSALIHAATMVTAGVYLIVKLHLLYLLAPFTLTLIGIIGASTALFAAFAALAQTDLKRVLAYSTVSQLGLMFLACGVGAFYAAMFHLTMHAFVKALLFLSAGNIVHMMNGNTNMDHMGGLWRHFEKTRWLFLIGVLALAGVPPLAIFFSKDLILEQASLAGYTVLFYIGLFTSVLTAFYLTRAYVLTFFGKARLNDKLIKIVQEAPSIMTAPVTVLAILSVVGGFLGYAFGKLPILEGFLARVGIGLYENHASGNYIYSIETLLAIFGAIFGIVSAFIIYTYYYEKLGKTIQLFKKAFYIDEIYEMIIVMPLQYFAKFIGGFVESEIVDKSIVVAADVTQGTAKWLQQMQSGQIRSYVAWMAIGAVLLMLYTLY